MSILDWFRTTEAPPVPEARNHLAGLELTDWHTAAELQQAAVLGLGRSSAIPSVFRAVQLLTDTVASLHMVAYDLATGNVLPAIPSILRRPDPFHTYHAHISQVMASLLWRGNAYLLRTGGPAGSQPTSVTVAHPDEITVAWNPDRTHRTYTWRGRAMRPETDLWHLALNWWPGALTGVGPIEACRIALDTAHAEGGFQRSLMANNATPSGVIKVAQVISTDEAEDIRAQFEGRARTTRHRVGVIGGGGSFEPITISPVDAEFLASREFSVQEIARMFGLPAFFLGVDSGSSLTYSTTESIGRLLVTFTLRPSYLEPIEQVYAQLMPPGLSARFDTDELLRADLTSRYTAYQVGLDAGFLTPNEVRATEGLPPVPDGDHLRPTTTPTTSPDEPAHAH